MLLNVYEQNLLSVNTLLYIAKCMLCLCAATLSYCIIQMDFTSESAVILL